MTLTTLFLDFFYVNNQFGYLNENSKRKLFKKRLLIFLIFIILLILTVIVIVVLALIPVYLSGNKSKDTGTNKGIATQLEFVVARIVRITNKRAIINDSTCGIDTTVINKN